MRVAYTKQYVDDKLFAIWDQKMYQIINKRTDTLKHIDRRFLQNDELQNSKRWNKNLWWHLCSQLIIDLMLRFIHCKAVWFVVMRKDTSIEFSE